MTYLKPVLPVTAKLAEEFLNTELKFNNIDLPLLDHNINLFKPLINRIDLDQLNKIITIQPATNNNNITKANNMSEKGINKTNVNETSINQTNVNDTSNKTSDIKVFNQINIEDFDKVELRIAKIINAQDVPEAAKLLKLTLDVGELGTKEVFAGIKASYSPMDLIGKYTVMVANLKERKMRFGISQGMVLAASGPNGDRVWLLEPDQGALPGMRVK